MSDIKAKIMTAKNTALCIVLVSASLIFVGCASTTNYVMFVPVANPKQCGKLSFRVDEILVSRKAERQNAFITPSRKFSEYERASNKRIANSALKLHIQSFLTGSSPNMEREEIALFQMSLNLPSNEQHYLPTSVDHVQKCEKCTVLSTYTFDLLLGDLDDFQVGLVGSYLGCKQLTFNFSKTNTSETRIPLINR
ncbi:MAG: hypothetical protein GY951_07400 [Psychromonas sp.]|nr:hypothetical protein [Psychromonas sp.]